MHSNVLCLFVVLMASAAHVVAQSADSTTRYDVAVGYAFMRDQDIAANNPDISANFSAGWMASAGVNLSSWFGAAGEVSGHYKTIAIPGDQPKVRVYAYLAGPRVRHTFGRISPFGQVLFGAAHASTSVLSATDATTKFSYQPGGGVEAHLSPGVGIRFEGDFRIIRSDGANSKEPGFAVAAVFGF